MSQLDGFFHSGINLSLKLKISKEFKSYTNPGSEKHLQKYLNIILLSWKFDRLMSNN